MASCYSVWSFRAVGSPRRRLHPSWFFFDPRQGVRPPDRRDRRLLRDRRADRRRFLGPRHDRRLRPNSREPPGQPAAFLRAGREPEHHADGGAVDHHQLHRGAGSGGHLHLRRRDAERPVAGPADRNHLRHLQFHLQRGPAARRLAEASAAAVGFDYEPDMPTWPISSIKALLEPTLNHMGFELYALDQSVHSGRTLRISIDPSEPITIEDCERVSRVAGPLLDHSNLIEGPYDLEVSSPGAERALRSHEEYQRFNGKRVNVRYRSGDSETVVEGQLVAVDAAGSAGQGAGGAGPPPGIIPSPWEDVCPGRAPGHN